MKKKLNLKSIQKMKQTGEPVSWITAYDLPFASAAENAGIDMILVGDSGGMVQLGYETTNPVTMDEMIVLAKSARRGAPNTFIVGDMPQGSYEISKEKAVENAMRFVKEAGCDAIKLEGGGNSRCWYLGGWSPWLDTTINQFVRWLQCTGQDVEEL